MKTTTIHLALALLTGAVATAQPGGGPNDRRPPPIPPIFAFFDQDHDGELSEDEIEAASEALGKLDRNKDGKITPKEMRPPRRGDEEPGGDGRPPRKPPLPPVIAALDTDRDGTISAAELEAAPESLKKLDENNDGELSPEELRPHGPPPPPPGDEPGNHQNPQGPPSEDREDGGSIEIE